MSGDLRDVQATETTICLRISSAIEARIGADRHGDSDAFPDRHRWHQAVDAFLEVVVDWRAGAMRVALPQAQRFRANRRARLRLEFSSTSSLLLAVGAQIREQDPLANQAFGLAVQVIQAAHREAMIALPPRALARLASPDRLASSDVPFAVMQSISRTALLGFHDDPVERLRAAIQSQVQARVADRNGLSGKSDLAVEIAGAVSGMLLMPSVFVPIQVEVRRIQIDRARDRRDVLGRALKDAVADLVVPRLDLRPPVLVDPADVRTDAAVDAARDRVEIE